jgi:hypothetical protein
VYEEEFERHFLDTTRIFYRQESTEFLSQNTCPDYMWKAEQRLAEDDWTGHVLSKDRGDWTHLMLPMEFEPVGRDPEIANEVLPMDYDKYPMKPPGEAKKKKRARLGPSFEIGAPFSAPAFDIGPDSDWALLAVSVPV